MKPPTPNCSLTDLRKEHPTAGTLFDEMIRHFMLQFYQKYPELGLEATQEAFEELIEKGYLCIASDDDGDSFYLERWNGTEYIRT